MAYQSFEYLKVWKAARGLKKEISALTKTIPDTEKYKLSDQLIRCSHSIGTQISEGYDRHTIPDRLRFCVVARSSLSETLNHRIDAFDEEYITEEKLSFFRNKIDEVGRLLNGYITYLNGQK